MSCRVLDMSEVKPDSPESFQVAIRLPRTLVDWIDAYAAELNEARPGLKVTRSSAARMLLEQAKADVESARGR
jgi:hypothetical protein